MCMCEHMCACEHMCLCVCACVSLSVLCRQSRGHCQQTNVCAWGEPGAPAWPALSCPLGSLVGGCSGPARQHWEACGAFSLATVAVRCSWRLGPGDRCSTYPAVLRASWMMKNCPARSKKHGAVPSESCPCGQTSLLCLLGTHALRPQRESSPTPPGPPWVRAQPLLCPGSPRSRSEPCAVPPKPPCIELSLPPRTLSRRAPVLWGT